MQFDYTGEQRRKITTEINEERSRKSERGGVKTKKKFFCHRKLPEDSFKKTVHWSIVQKIPVPYP